MASNHHMHDLRLNHDDANAQECHELHGVHFTDDGSPRFSMTERSLPNSQASRARHRATRGLMAREVRRRGKPEASFSTIVALATGRIWPGGKAWSLAE